MRMRTGARARGSKLLDPGVLDDVLSAWIVEVPLVVLLVDGDDKRPDERAQILREALDRNGFEGAVGVAVREFESWLLADQAALNHVFGPGKQSPAKIEAMDCRLAKETINSWAAEIAHEGRSALSIRRQLAAAVDLQELGKRCPSFAAFRQEFAQLDLR